MKRRNIQTKYPLDNSGIIHLAVLKKGFSNSFRLSVTLTEMVDPQLLQKAVNIVTPRFPTIVAGIQSGFFRHWVVPVQVPPDIQLDCSCLAYMPPEQIRICGIRVLYRNTQIAVEFFHSLTDGYGGFQFLKTMLAEYLKLAKGLENPADSELLIPEKATVLEEIEDSYAAYATKRKMKLNHMPSYQMAGKTVQADGVHTTTIIFPLKELLQTAHDYHVTLTTLLTAVMAASIMELQMRQVFNRNLKPVQIMVPVNLRKLFPSRSLRNFSLYALPQIKPGDEVLPIVNIILNHSLRKYGALALTGFSVDGATLAITVGTIVTATSSFIRQPINGFSQGLQPVISYNYGAGEHKRVKDAIRFAIMVTTAYAAALWLFMMLFPGTISQMFTSSNEVVDVSRNLIRIYVLGMVFSGVQSTLVQAFIARGMKSHSLMVSLFCKGMYIPLLLILPLLVPVKYGVAAIYSAQAVTDVLAVIFSTVLYITTIGTDRKAIDACYELIQKTQPDLIIVTGDIVYPIPYQTFSKNNLKPIYQFCTFMNNVGIPWAMVYGNHDTEAIASYDIKSLEGLYRYFKQEADCPMLYAEKQPDIYGRYNQYLRIENPDGSLNRLAFLIDSNDYVKYANRVNEYDSVHPDQIEWYSEV